MKNDEVKDIVPELFDKIDKTFKLKAKESKIIKDKLKILKNKKANYKDANEFAVEVGKILADTFQDKIKTQDLPDGKMYYNIAKRLIEPNMVRNHDLVSEYSKEVQSQLNKQANISIKAQKADLNQDRIDKLVDKITKYDSYDDGKWLLNGPIVNFTLAAVDETIRKNADLHAKAGLSPKIERYTNGKCCDWCDKLAGIYNYEDVKNAGNEVFRRHRHCDCLVIYDPKNGSKRTNIHTHKPVDNNEEKEKRKKRIELSEKENTNNKFPKELAGVKRGNMMSFEEADGNKPNPKYLEDRTYRINCQTCVVAYEARRRGYNVEAKGNFKGSLSEMLSRATNRAWIDPKTGTYPKYIEPDHFSDINTPSKYINYLNSVMKDNTRYTMEFGWKGRDNSGHIVHIFKDKDKIEIYDPQTGKIYNNLKKYLGKVKMTRTLKGLKVTTAPKLLEVENYGFNLEIVNEILRQSGDE